MESDENAFEEFHGVLLSIACSDQIGVKDPERMKVFSNKKKLDYLESAFVWADSECHSYSLLSMTTPIALNKSQKIVLMHRSAAMLGLVSAFGRICAVM